MPVDHRPTMLLLHLLQLLASQKWWPSFNLLDGGDTKKQALVWWLCHLSTLWPILFDCWWPSPDCQQAQTRGQTPVRIPVFYYYYFTANHYRNTITRSKPSTGPDWWFIDYSWPPECIPWPSIATSNMVDFADDLEDKSQVRAKKYFYAMVMEGDGDRTWDLINGKRGKYPFDGRENWDLSQKMILF